MTAATSPDAVSNLTDRQLVERLLTFVGGNGVSPAPRRLVIPLHQAMSQVLGLGIEVFDELGAVNFRVATYSCCGYGLLLLLESLGLAEGTDRWKRYVENDDELPGEFVHQVVTWVRQHYAVVAEPTLTDSEYVKLSLLIRQLWRTWARAPRPVDRAQADECTRCIVRALNDVKHTINSINELYRPFEQRRILNAKAATDIATWGYVNGQLHWPFSR